MARNYNSSQANMLRTQGVSALGTLGIKCEINPIGFYSPNKRLYKTLWQNYDCQQCVSRYIWDDLPNGYTSWEIERMLYLHGAIALFVVAGEVYFFPFVSDGEPNPRGFPTSIKPITYNGAINGSFSVINENFNLPINANGNLDFEGGAVILYDQIPLASNMCKPLSRAMLNDIIINDIIDTMARININIVVTNKKIGLVIKDAKQRDVVQKELEKAFASDCPFFILTSPLEVDTVQSTSDFNSLELFSVLKNYDAIRCFMNGISTKGFGSEKKERVITGELEGANEEKDLILDLGYDLRKEFCERVNRMFGLNIKVSRRADVEGYDDLNPSQFSLNEGGEVNG